MGKEASIRHKSTKLPVQLYRAFLKLSLAGTIYAAFCIFKGQQISETGLAVTVAVLGAILYEITYYVYKSRSNESISDGKDPTWKQVVGMLKLIGFFLGHSAVIFGAVFLREGKILGAVMMISGLVLCQQLHNNKRLFSHLSTFCENAAAGFIVITLELIFNSFASGNQNSYWIISAAITVTLYALSEVFFHFFNLKKHKGKVEKKVLLLDRLAQFLRNALLVLVMWLAFALLMISGSTQFFIDIGVFDKAIAIIPIVITLTSPVLKSQKKLDRKIEQREVFDPRIAPSEFKQILKKDFGENSLSIKALDFVCEKMNRKNGMTRYSGEDYFVHPIAVAKLLLDNTNANDELICAALLHDCIEDIDDCTYESIKTQYGKRVADCVMLVTKEKGKDYDDPKVMGEYIDKISESNDASLVKIADRMNNVSTMTNRTPEDKEAKYEETRVYYPALIAKSLPRDSANRRFYETAEKCFTRRIE